MATTTTTKRTRGPVELPSLVVKESKEAIAVASRGREKAPNPLYAAAVAAKATLGEANATSGMAEGKVYEIPGIVSQAQATKVQSLLRNAGEELDVSFRFEVNLDAKKVKFQAITSGGHRITRERRSPSKD
jgi:hypothetical protein